MTSSKPPSAGFPLDRASLDQVAQGTPNVVDAWFRAEHPRVYRLCFGFLADAEEAEDAAQDAMLHLLDHLDHWDGARSYESWRSTVVLNHCRDRVRRSGARRRAEETASEERVELHSDDPLGAIERNEVQEVLRESLVLLSPREREVFVLRDLEEVPTGEVAAAMGVTAGTVRSLLTLARRRLREGLGARLFGDPDGEAGR